MASSAGKTETLELRVSSSQKARVREASEILGVSMTDFVLTTVEPVARSVVERDGEIRLSRQAWREFIELTEREIAATPTAKREAAEFVTRYGVEASASTP